MLWIKSYIIYFTWKNKQTLQSNIKNKAQIKYASQAKTNAACNQLLTRNIA